MANGFLAKVIVAEKITSRFLTDGQPYIVAIFLCIEERKAVSQPVGVLCMCAVASLTSQQSTAHIGGPDEW
jgi:hypothetical protein